MPTNAQIISLAPGASYLAANDVRKSALFDNFIRLNPILPQQIYAIYFITNKIYTLNPNYPGMTAVCLYLWEIMGKYGVAAQGLSGGGGSVSPITPPGSNINTIEFIIGGVSSIPNPISSRGNTLMINGTNGNPDFRGYNIIFNRNNIPQGSINNSGSYFTWSKVTGQFVCFGNAGTGEDFQIVPTI